MGIVSSKFAIIPVSRSREITFIGFFVVVWFLVERLMFGITILQATIACIRLLHDRWHDVNVFSFFMSTIRVDFHASTASTLVH